MKDTFQYFQGQESYKDGYHRNENPYEEEEFKQKWDAGWMSEWKKHLANDAKANKTKCINCSKEIIDDDTYTCHQRFYKKKGTGIDSITYKLIICPECGALNAKE